jgi:hypothetical protein
VSTQAESDEFANSANSNGDARGALLRSNVRRGRRSNRPTTAESASLPSAQPRAGRAEGGWALPTLAGPRHTRQHDHHVRTAHPVGTTSSEDEAGDAKSAGRHARAVTQRAPLRVIDACRSVCRAGQRRL